MNQPLRTTLFLLFTAFLASPAHALGPFSWPGQADLPPLNRSFQLGSLLVEDKAGSLYLSDGTCQAAGSTQWTYFSPVTDAWGLAPAGDGVVGWVTTPGADPAQEHVQIVHLKCADLDPVNLKGPKDVWQELAAFDRPKAGDNLKSQPLLVSQDGSICHVRPAGAGVECATFPGGKLQLDMRLDVSDLDARVTLPKTPPLDKLPKDDAFVPKVPEAWRVRYGTFAPDGRLFLVAERQSWIYGQDGVAYAHPAWLLEVPAGPQPPVVPGKPLPLHSIANMIGVGADGRIAWEPTLGMIALFSEGDYSHEQYAVPGGDGNGNPVAAEFGLAGAGLRLIRPSDGLTAYLSLTDAIARRRECNTKTYQSLTCDSGYGPPQLWQRPDGSLGLTLPFTHYNGPGDVDRAMRLHAIQFDAATVDFDGDGLSRATEAQLGSSDWSEDTDGGGTVDGAELLVAKTNPQDAKDDAWPRINRPGQYAMVRSGLLLGLRDLVPKQETALAFAETWSVQGPLCVQGVCQDVDGQIVAHYADPATKSVDGTHLIVTGNLVWERLFFADGHRELAATRAEVDALLPPSPSGYPSAIRMLPVDANTLFVVREQAAARVALFERGKPGRVIFDLQQLRCDSGLGPCDKHPGGAAKTILPIHDIPRDQMTLVGYVPTTQRVILGVAGSWDLYLLGLHATEPLAVMRRGPSLGGLLHWILPMGPCDPGGWQCDLLSDAGLMDPYLTTRNTWLGPENKDVPVIPHFSGAWGDTALRAVDGMELVRYEPGVDPGDTLLARMVEAPLGSEGVMLYVSKPRGGLVPLWPQVEHGIVGMDGMDVTATGTLCIADRAGKQLWEYVSQVDRVPALLQTHAEVGEILDCKYDAKGDLHLLFNDPPRIEVRQGVSVTTVPGQALVAGKHPQSLVKKPDGTLEVIYTEDNLRGRLYTLGGHKVEVPQSTEEVRHDGAATTTVKLWWVNAISPPMAAHQGRVTLAERADGLILVGGTGAAQDEIGAVISQFYAIDPRTGRVAHPWEGTYIANRMLAVAVVPGGAAVDPWTHRPVAVQDDQEIPSVPAPQTVPTGGQKQAVATVSVPGASSAKSGCQASARTPVSSLVVPLLASVVWVLRRRRHAWVSTARSR